MIVFKSMNKRIIITLQIGLISFFMFADQNLMGPNLTLIADDLGRGFGPFIIGNILIYHFGRNMAFNIANIFWLLYGIFILIMIRTFPKENKGEVY